MYSFDHIILLYWVELIVRRPAIAKHRYWALITVFLLAVIVIGGIIAWQRYSPSQPIEISLPPSPQFQGEVYIGGAGEQKEPQKIDINRADAWLLMALPGIGESKAQAIIDYRQQNGGFRSITEITSVEGIGPTIYEQIKLLITVTD